MGSLPLPSLPPSPHDQQLSAPLKSCCLLRFLQRPSKHATCDRDSSALRQSDSDPTGSDLLEPGLQELVDLLGALQMKLSDIKASAKRCKNQRMSHGPGRREAKRGHTNLGGHKGCACVLRVWFSVSVSCVSVSLCPCVFVCVSVCLCV